MAFKLCPHCMRASEEAICPHCGKNVNYAGSPAHLPAGYVVNGKHPYVLGAALGQGGFGITYIALDMVTNERVAIKEYFPAYCSGRTNSSSVTAYSKQEDIYQKGKDRFLEEARTLKSLSDLPNIVNVLDFFGINNTAYLVMEYLDGSSLKEYAIQHGKFPAQQFLQQIRPLMEDISKMHDRGVIHRDIAPDNIILLPDGQMKLIDFGSARSYLGDKSMTVVVKKGFAPLEQYFSTGATASTDVYALSATIYYCITGTVPMDSAQRQNEGTPLESLSALGADTTPFQEDALFKALEIQQKNRTQSVLELLNALSVTEEPEPEDRKEISKPEAPEKTEEASENTSPILDHPPKKDAFDRKTLLSRLKLPEKKLPLKVIIPGAAALLLLVSVLLFSPSFNSGKYFQARKHLSQERYAEASQLFAELGDFWNSRSLWEQAAYAEAELLLKDKRFEEASPVLEELGNYRDSYSLWEQSVYAEAELLLAEAQFDEALQKIVCIPNHEKAADLKNECLYQRGSALLKEKQYEDAYADLSQIPDNYKQNHTLLSTVKLDWGKNILDNAKLSSARKFKSDVTLTAAESDEIYKYIISKNFYNSILNTSNAMDFQTRRCMMDTLVGTYPLKESLCTLFDKFTASTSETFIKNNRPLIAKLWDVPVMQNIIREDNNFCIWLLGKWKASNGLSIHFYQKENDTSIWSTIGLPWVKKPAGTKYWNITDLEYLWVDENEVKLASVYRFELTGPDTMDVYCYKNERTYSVTLTE